MEPKKEIAPLDRLQHVFNDVLEDLAHTTRRTWDSMGLDHSQQKLLTDALDVKLDSYRGLYAEAREKVTAQIVEADDLEYERCDYCEGEGGTEFEVGGVMALIPCIVCDGSGQVVKEGGSD